MGTNNRQRRAAKAKARAKDSRVRGGGAGPQNSGSDEMSDLALVRNAIIEAVRNVADNVETPESLAAKLLGPDPRMRALIAEVALDLRDMDLDGLTHDGWTPNDLHQILRRRVDAGAAALIAGYLREQVARVAAELVGPEWQAELDELPPAPVLDLTTFGDLVRMLPVLAVLRRLPPLLPTLPPPGKASRRMAGSEAAEAADANTARQLARVRALLAKAESTTYEAEAEALTAKAQELITRHALERLLARADAGELAPSVATRRVWIDAPYVMPKAMLVNAVGDANRCRVVVSEELGFVTLLGDPRDLTDVELLSTSLLVQADAAMLRQGRQQSGGGTSRSFRQSFLISYANRIGERLRASAETALDETDRERLLPVLRAASEEVEREFQRLFPSTKKKGAKAYDAAGWDAGRVAADLAQLDVHGQVAGA